MDKWTMLSKRLKAKAIVSSFFQDDSGNNFKLTNGQADIFNAVCDPKINRVAIKCITQYGKSLVTALALDAIAVSRKEKIIIVSPSEKQSRIIMGYVILHLFDHDYLKSSIEWEGSLERLKQERSKKRVTFNSGSEIFILTAMAREVEKEAKNLMGFGASIVVIDESSLIEDKMYAKILRMVGGVKDGKLIKLGNPFVDNHFGRSFKSDRYYKISVDWRQALTEGRITKEFLDEAKEDMSALDWLIFYECEFPKVGTEDAVIPLDLINNAVNREGCGGEHRQAGLDIARFGGDSTVYIFRVGGEVKRMEVVDKMDTMEIVGNVRQWLKEDKPDVLAVDIIGIGSGVYDRLEELNDEGELTDKDGEELDIEIEEVNVGKAPTDDEMKEKYVNLRAQIFFNLGKQFKQGAISIPDDPDLKKQLSEIKYKFSSERKRKIEPKEEMKKRLGQSPDKADALSLAFFDTSESEPQMMIENA